MSTIQFLLSQFLLYAFLVASPNQTGTIRNYPRLFGNAIFLDRQNVDL